MRLTEYEGKILLKKTGIDMPDFCLLKEGDLVPNGLSYPVMIKAQTLTGWRGKTGLVKAVVDKNNAELVLKEMWQSRYDKRPFDRILIEPRQFSGMERYVGFIVDSSTRGLILIYCKFGGMDIKVVARRQPHAIVKMPIDPIRGLDALDWDELFKRGDVKNEIRDPLKDLIEKLYQVFKENDCLIAEINPFIEVVDKEGCRLLPVDSKIGLDETAFFRHDFNYPRRVGIRPLTEMEQRARDIDARSHRGVVGRTFLEWEGDVAVMSSGGGAGLTCLDALMTYKGQPACLAEYSGNPEREDVRDLTKLVLSKQGLRALWVVGPTANFTDVYETLSGVMDALKEIRPDFPIFIRRAGPRDDEAKEMIKQSTVGTGLDVTFYGEEVSMTESARLLMNKIGGSPGEPIFYRRYT